MTPCTIAVAVLLLAVVALLFLAAGLMDARAKIHEDLAICRERLSWMRRKDQSKSKR